MALEHTISSSKSNQSDPSMRINADPDPGVTEKWKALLIELVHLLGLFLIHTRHSKGARATEIIFEQFVRHLDIMAKMPGQDGGVVIRRFNRNKIEAGIEKPDYILQLGKLVVEGSSDINVSIDSRRRTAHMFSALNQAYGCLAEQGIHSFFLHLPGRSSERIDQIRLGLNIIARFHQSVEQGASIITFRYFGRVLTIPIVRDIFGLQDPNLTLLAGINGLSGPNARELVRQTEAYCGLGECKDVPAGPINTYNRIFSVRSLRSQLIRPLVEINNLPWMQAPQDNTPVDTAKPDKAAAVPSAANSELNSRDCEPCIQLVDLINPPIAREQILDYVNAEDPGIQTMLADLFETDFAALDSIGLAKQFFGITNLLFLLEKNYKAHSIIERFLHHIYHQLECISESMLLNIVVQKQGVRIMAQNRAIVVGMVHPRLFELIVLMQERVLTYHKIAVLQSYGYEFDRCDKAALAERFETDEVTIGLILNAFKDSFDRTGTFNRTAFYEQLPRMVQHENTVFEMLWCMLKQAPLRSDRLALVNAMQHVMDRLPEPKHALRFLLADLFYDPFRINFADRNAFVLSILLLRTHNKELDIDIDKTPDEVLKVKKGINLHTRQYAAWRMDVDQVRVLTKFRTIRDRISRALIAPVDTEDSTLTLNYLLSLEREAFIFLALTSGRIARIALRIALAFYGRPQSEIYSGQLCGQYMPMLMDHLEIAVRALGRIGRRKDLEVLKTLEQTAPRLYMLQSGSDHALRVNQIMKWVAPAIRMIQLRSR
jgi:hypothetical protein